MSGDCENGVVTERSVLISAPVLDNASEESSVRGLSAVADFEISMIERGIVEVVSSVQEHQVSSSIQYSEAHTCH